MTPYLWADRKEFCFSPSLAHGMVHLPGWASPLLLCHSEKHPQLVLRCLFWVVANLVRGTVKTRHQSITAQVSSSESWRQRMSRIPRDDPGGSVVAWVNSSVSFPAEVTIIPWSISSYCSRVWLLPVEIAGDTEIPRGTSRERSCNLYEPLVHKVNNQHNYGFASSEQVLRISFDPLCFGNWLAAISSCILSWILHLSIFFPRSYSYHLMLCELASG